MKKQPTRRPTFIRQDAYGCLPRLSELLTQDTGVRVNFTQAASIAIIKETERLERREQKRLLRQQAVTQ